MPARSELQALRRLLLNLRGEYHKKRHGGRRIAMRREARRLAARIREAGGDIAARPDPFRER